MTRRLLLASVALAAACSSTPAGPLQVADMPAIDTAAALGHITRLSSDEFEGRSPGTKGETLTVQYLIDQFKAMGLEPGNPDGTYVQKVPLVGIKPENFSPLVVKKGGQTASFAPREDVVAFSQQVTETINLADSELVFVGYGIQAPEFQWDDFRGVDVKGKTIIVLVNDPPIPMAGSTDELDPTLFGGKAMTYYGRWTYKYDKAAELGAAGVLVVHETAPAGYPFTVVQGFSDQRFGLITADKNMGRAAIAGT